MSRRTFTFEIVDLYNSHENRDKIRSLLGDDLLGIDRVKPHVIVATSEDPEKVRVTLEYMTGKKAILLYEHNRHNQPSQSLQKSLQHGKGKQGSIVPTSNHVPAAQVQALQYILQSVSATVLVLVVTVLGSVWLNNGDELTLTWRYFLVIVLMIVLAHWRWSNNPGPRTTTNVQAPQVITGAGVHKSSASLRLPKSYHKHNLISTKGTKLSYTCNGCKERGMGDRYVCNDCSYILHPNCMYYEERATHKFFEGSTFKFHQKPLDSKNRICNACGLDIRGFFYNSSKNDKDLHPCCLKLLETVLLEGRNFRLCKTLTSKSKCFHCGLGKKKDDKGKRWCYSSERQNLQSHVSCMKAALLKCGTVYYYVNK